MHTILRTACVPLLLLSGCAGRAGGADPGGEVTPEASSFSFRMAGALVLADDPLDGSAAQLEGDHFSYVGQYAVNGCQNDTTPYGCAQNGCNYPGNPQSSEIPSYDALRDFLAHYQGAGMYAGLWGVSYQHPEAEGHCIAEVLNTLRSAYGVTPTFVDVDGEKSFETNQGYSQRFVDEFNPTIAFPIARAYTPECHTEVPFAVWLKGGFTSIQPMAYWDDPQGGQNPSYCLNWLASHGVPHGQSQVMLDGYRHGTPHSWAEYADDIESFGGKGFSIWRSVSSGEWDQWKGLIESRGIAQYNGGGGCTPSCGGKSCGDDGCGGSCGSCPSGESCSGGSCVGAPPASCGVLSPGQGLKRGQHLPSCDGRFALWMQSDGNLVLYEHATPLWATHTSAGDTVWMQSDGNLVLYSGAGKALWASGTYNHPGALAAVQDDGNLVVYLGAKPLWASNTCCH